MVSCSVVALKGTNVHVNRFICISTIDTNIYYIETCCKHDNSTNFIVYT